MKKFFGILAAVMVAVLSVFNLSGNYKNTAEPQYFLENTQVKNAAIYNNQTNDLVIYINDNNVNPQPQISDEQELFALSTNSVISYTVNGSNEYITINVTINEPIIAKFYAQMDSGNTYQNYYIDLGNNVLLGCDWVNSGWELFDDGDNVIANNLTSVKITNLEEIIIYPTYLDEIFGDATSLPDIPSEPTVPLIQIGSIITDTIGWFTNIFTGLSTAFYIDGALTTWGTVLFIGVAITLIAMCLKWLISLIKGV